MSKSDPYPYGTDPEFKSRETALTAIRKIRDLVEDHKERGYRINAIAVDSDTYDFLYRHIESKSDYKIDIGGHIYVLGARIYRYRGLDEPEVVDKTITTCNDCGTGFTPIDDGLYCLGCEERFT